MNLSGILPFNLYFLSTDYLRKNAKKYFVTLHTSIQTM